MWTIDNTRHFTASVPHQAPQFVVYRIERRPVKQSATYTGLIGRNRHGEAGSREFCDSLYAAFDGPEFVRRFHELRRVIIDHAVTI
jgi:hypothetical protein